MKALPLPFEDFRGKRELDFGSSSDSFSFLEQHHHPHQQRWNPSKEHCYVGCESISVLDITSNNRSPPTSSSTVSSSHGSTGVGNGGGCGCGSTDSNTGVALTITTSENLNTTTTPPPPPTSAEKCSMELDDWRSVLPESPGQDQSILRLIMEDIEDPSVGLSKLLQSGGDGGGGGGSQDVEFSAFSVMDQAYVPVSDGQFTSGNLLSSADSCVDFPFNVRLGSAPNLNPIFTASASGMTPVSLPPTMFHHPQQLIRDDSVDEKPQVFNTQLMMNQNQAQFPQNPPLSMHLLQETQLLPQPAAKRLNPGLIGQGYNVPKIPFSEWGQEQLFGRQQQQFQLLPHHLQHRSPPMVVSSKQKVVNHHPSEDLTTHQLQQATIDQLFKAAELIESGNPVLAHGILARLNHQLSPNGKPSQRAAFYMKEALQLLLHANSTNSVTFSPSSLTFKIGAYKSFSEISPILQFANFTCNQALLEAVEGYDRIHIIDFDIGFGGQWASFMQELALRTRGSPHLKITAFVSPSVQDEIEVGFTQENLKQYANELNLSFELKILSLELLNSGSWPQTQTLSDSTEAVAVNLPIVSLNYPSTFTSVLRFVKQLIPKIVVTLDRSCDRTDVSFANHFMHSLQSYSALLESLDAVHANFDIVQTIEKHFLQPAMEKIVLGRHRLQERTHPWKTVLLSSGFSPLTFSNFTESQAECLVQRTPVRGFHLEKKQSALALCWQGKDLVSVSTWRC